EILRDEIRRGGPVSFARFMETALYHPEHGYYRGDPFGRSGDFFTAEQIQPVFGILMAARIRMLWEEAGSPEDFTVVELGAGRREMTAHFSAWRYVPVEIGSGALPACFRGVVFSNEFFDALPVHAAEYVEDAFRERLVGLEGDRFVWVRGGPASEAVEAYLRRYFPEPVEGNVYEANLQAMRWMERIAGALADGWMLTIDYGYTRPEAVRFPQGTLMSYRSHTARDAVLDSPGRQDITAHVAFTALAEHGSRCGLEQVRFENLSRTLLDAGERDQFHSALAGGAPAEESARRLQLKTLMFGMGETFRVLLQRKAKK
ncbi:MAG: SAM-dependent methyltransferase, partial [Acidobacteria bacterium]|nr:SAM-dependent methyltransferase [Acidobacteriota bacterium]